MNFSIYFSVSVAKFAATCYFSVRFRRLEDDASQLSKGDFRGKDHPKSINTDAPEFARRVCDRESTSSSKLKIIYSIDLNSKIPLESNGSPVVRTERKPFALRVNNVEISLLSTERLKSTFLLVKLEN